MKERAISQFVFSIKGYLIIVFLLCLIVMPVCENYLNIAFSAVFPIVIANTWLIGKALFKDRNEKPKIIFDILLMIVLTAACLYFL